MQKNNFSFEKLQDGIEICVSETHRFGSDAFLLASFAAPRKKDIVCDLGTGCGIIPLILCKRFMPKKIYGVDIQPLAIEQFNMSIERSGKAVGEVELHALCEDLNKLPSCELLPCSFDVVTCNPPYKAGNTGILSEEQGERIARHEVMCTITDVCAAAARLLRFGGRLCICQRPERLADTITAMRQNDIEPKLVRFVAKTKSHEPWLFLIEGKKGSKPFMRVMPTLEMYDENGDFSAELKGIYGNYYEAEDE